MNNLKKNELLLMRSSVQCTLVRTCNNLEMFNGYAYNSEAVRDLAKNHQKRKIMSTMDTSNY